METKGTILYFLFQGSLKGNHGVAGVGGLFFTMVVKTCACGFGIGKNNQDERFSLYFGLKLYVEVGVRILIVIGDSLLVLSQVKQRKEIQGQIVSRLHERILSSFSHFKSLYFYHVCRNLNNLVDGLANQTSQLPRGSYKDSEGSINHISIP